MKGGYQPSASRRGRTIVILGPDGAGKSTLAAELLERLGGPERVHHVHLRSPILPRRTSVDAGPVTEPHGQEPYGPVLSLAKIGWLYVDMQAMWRGVVPRIQRDGRDVIVERGWWDLVIDPRRYRLRDSTAARRLGHTFPRPDLEVVLTGPARILAGRKAELSVAEIERQTHAWADLRPPSDRTLHLDADRPLRELVERVLAHPALQDPADGVLAAVRADRLRGDRWVRLPPWREDGLRIPRSSRAVARAGLRIYQPVTTKARLGWWAARTVAAVGGFALLPGHPAMAAIETIADVTPPDCTFSVALGRRPGRAAILVMDREGRTLALAKTATDDAGRARLHHEATHGLALQHALSSPLSSPRLLAHGDGFLLFEAVDWIPRRDAWTLPLEVAEAIGRFYRAGAREDHVGGYTHGDLAPWNLMRTERGWSIVDWADARPDGPPFYDILHYLVQAHALLGRPTQDELVDGLHGLGSIARVIEAYAEAAGLDPRDVLTYVPEYLDTSERWLAPGADRGRGESARADLRIAVGRPPS